MVQSQVISLTIGQLAKQAQVNIETIRYYQRLGLLDTPNKAGSTRRYDQQALQRLLFIKNAKEADFTLREIHELLALDATTDHDAARAIAIKKIAAIDDKLAALEHAKASLNKLVGQCQRNSPAHTCAILDAFTKS